MAVQSRIDAEDEWFVGEDRVIRFTFDPAGTGVGFTGWEMVFELFGRRARADAEPLLTQVAAPVVIEGKPLAVVQIDGDATTDLGAGLYQFVLRRTDEGARAVLAFGPAELRTAVNT